MPSIKKITDAIEEDSSLKEIAESLSEIAAHKLKKIRDGILQNGAFFNELTSVYSLIKVVAAQRKLLAGKKLTEQAKELKTASILITSNGKLYGTLEKSVIDLFVKNSSARQTDKIVIGKTGIQTLTAAHFGPFEEVIFTKDLPPFQEIKNLLSKTVGYDRILVYYPKFQSVLTQIPFIRDIKEAFVEASLPKKKIDYILEPEIDKMLAFFDLQISMLLLEQSLLETELARTAARLVAMDRAQSNANDTLALLRKELGIAKRSLNNIRLLESIGGSFIIRKEMATVV